MVGKDIATITVNGKKYKPEELPSELSFSLRKPVVLTEGLSFETIELQEPTIAEYEAFEKSRDAGNSIRAMINLIVAVAVRKGQTELSAAAVNMIGIRDVNEMSQYLAAFINPGQ